MTFRPVGYATERLLAMHAERVARTLTTEYTNRPTKGVFCDRCRRWFPGPPGTRHTCRPSQ